MTRLAETPDAFAAYAVGVGAAAGRGAFYALVFLMVFFGAGFAPLGMGVVLVVLSIVLPALGAAIVLEVLPRLKAKIGS